MTIAGNTVRLAAIGVLVWDGLTVYLDLTQKADFLYDIVPDWLGFLVNPTFRLVLLIIALFSLYVRTKNYGQHRTATAGWIQRKPFMLTFGLFLLGGCLFGVGGWLWFAYGPEPELHYSLDSLLRLPDDDLKADATEFARKISNLYSDLNKRENKISTVALKDMNANPQSKLDLERMRRDRSDQEVKKFERIFQRKYLQSALALDMAIRSKLGKMLIIGPVNIPMGVSVGGGNNLPQRPVELESGLINNPGALKAVADYFEHMAKLL